MSVLTTYSYQGPTYKILQIIYYKYIILDACVWKMLIFDLLWGWFCCGILFAMGWRMPSEKTFREMEKKGNKLVVFSHTSYIDFYIMALYISAYKDRLQNIRILVKPQPFEYAGPILRYFQCVASTRIEDKNMGSVQRIVQTVKDVPNVALFLSPKGTIEKNQWRTGYYYIAKELGATVMTIGLDYEKREILSMEPISSSLGINVVEKHLKVGLSAIVPLYPEGEIVTIREHQYNNVGVCSSYTKLLLGLFIVRYVYYTKPLFMLYVLKCVYYGGW